MIDTKAIYTIWLREIKRFLRAKSRIIGLIVMPLLFLVGLGYGLNSFVQLSNGVSYFTFLVPGIIGMTLLFTSIQGGVSVLWDRQFGFLKEIMVTPNSRVSIVLGRVAGGTTTTFIQGIIVLIIALLLGFHFNITAVALLSLVFMLLIGITFLSLGLALGSFMRDFQGFGIVMMFVSYPLFFLSGALVPLTGLPAAVQDIAYANPLTYGVDGLRGALLGISSFPMAVDLGVMVVAALVALAVCTWAFRFNEAG